MIDKFVNNRGNIVARRQFRNGVRQIAAFDVFVNNQKYGEWIGKCFYPEKNCPHITCVLMEFLLQIGTGEQE